MSQLAPILPLYIHELGVEDEAELARQIANGARFIAYGIDTVFLWRNARRPAPQK